MACSAHKVNVESSPSFFVDCVLLKHNCTEQKVREGTRGRTSKRIKSFPHWQINKIIIFSILSAVMPYFYFGRGFVMIGAILII